MHTVSVIIPNYNHARYLSKRIESILNQTLNDFELIILDDCSTDDSLRIIEKYSKHSRVKVIQNDINSGCVFKQWNKGIRAASGDYIWLAESDDYADIHFLEHMVPVLRENTDVGLVKCRSHLIDHSGDQINERWHEDEVRWQSDFIVSGQEECKRHLFGMNYIANASAVLFRKETYIRAGYADETQKLSGDWNMWLNMMQISNFASISRKLNYWRRHKESVRSKTHKDGSEILEIINLKVKLMTVLTLTEQEKNDAYFSLVSKWIDTFFYFNKFSTLDYHLIPFSNNRLIFRKLKHHDNIFFRHLIYCIYRRAKKLIRFPFRSRAATP